MGAAGAGAAPGSVALLPALSRFYWRLNICRLLINLHINNAQLTFVSFVPVVSPEKVKAKTYFSNTDHLCLPLVFGC